MFKFIFLFPLFFYLLNIQAQRKSQLSCEDLDNIFSNEDVRNHFILGKIKDSLTFVDTFHIFKCNNLKVNDEDVKFRDTYTKEISQGDRSSRYVTTNIIVLQQAKVQGKKYKITLWQCKDNAVAIVELQKKKKLKIRIITLGIY